MVHTLLKLAQSGNPDRPIEILELPQHHIDKIKSNEDAEKVLSNCASKLIFWGKAKLRNIDGKEVTILEMNVFVSHGLITTGLSEVFAKEMRELLPTRLLVQKENDLIEMELNAMGLDLAAHYIVAVASFFTDIPYALQLFKALKTKLESYNTTGLPDGLVVHIVNLRKRVPINITYCLLDLSREEHMKWRKNRDNLDPLKLWELYTSQTHVDNFV